MLNNSIRFAMVSGLTGLIFGLGLVVSGMANPAKVIGFLNLSMPWDPSLMFVMGGAIAIGLPGFYLAKLGILAFHSHSFDFDGSLRGISAG